MQLVIDANILIAAFLKSSVTRELLFDDDIELFAPEYFALEVKNTFKKDKSLRRRAGINEKQLEELLGLLLSQIKIIPEEEYESFIPKAVQNVPYTDMSAFKEFILGEGAYEFIEGAINIIGHDGLLPLLEEIRRRRGGQEQVLKKRVSKFWLNLDKRANKVALFYCVLCSALKVNSWWRLYLMSRQ